MMAQTLTYIILFTKCVLPSSPAPSDLPDDVLLKFILRSGQLDDEKKLLGLGDRLFPQFERFLSDKETSPYVVDGVFHVLIRVKADRSRFVEHTIARLAHSWPSTRMYALDLLAQIGGEKEAAPVIALLSDEHLEVTGRAARTLALIGGSRELIALDAWLLPSKQLWKEGRREGVAKRRNELNERLKSAKKVLD